MYAYARGTILLFIFIRFPLSLLADGGILLVGIHKVHLGGRGGSRLAPRKKHYKGKERGGGDGDGDIDEIFGEDAHGDDGGDRKAGKHARNDAKDLHDFLPNSAYKFLFIVA